MDEDDKPRAPLAYYTGPPSAAPYPMSRMAPSFSLVDTAREIETASNLLATVTGGKLEVIADQIRALQAKAHELMERARKDAELHAVRCNFQKAIGRVYHLYRRHDSGQKWFLLVGPHEWSSPPPLDWLGTYRLEADMSFTPLAEASPNT